MADEYNPDPLAAVHQEITIHRTWNGWVIRSTSESMRGYLTPMAVAETPKVLAELIETWAAAQALEADKAKRQP